MADVIFNRKDLQLLQEGKALTIRFQKYEDYGYLPIPLILDYFEKSKKGSGIIPSELKKLLLRLQDVNIILIELSKSGLLSALTDNEFEGKYVNRVGNPFEFASEACLYEYEGWWDRCELLDSLQEITWV